MKRGSFVIVAAVLLLSFPEWARGQLPGSVDSAANASAGSAPPGDCRTEAETADAIENRFSRFSVRLLTACAAVPNVAILLCQLIPEFMSVDPAVLTTAHSLLTSVPLYFLNPWKAASYDIASLSFYGLSAGAEKLNNDYVYGVPMEWSFKIPFYLTYETYKEARARARPGAYSSDLRNYGIGDLLLAPFRLRNLREPRVWLPVLGISGLLYAMYSGSGMSVWDNETAYFGEWEMPTWLAAFSILATSAAMYTATGVGEEAFSRGTIYQELLETLDVGRAKFFDYLIFVSMHIPGDIAMLKYLGMPGMAELMVLGRLLTGFMITPLFQAAYTKGGLPMSIALHTWWNTAVTFVAWMTSWRVAPYWQTALTGPPGEKNSNAGRLPPLYFRFSFAF